jgi:type I restriction enzyme S subunit
VKPFESVPSDWSLARVDRVATVRARIGWKALTATEYVDSGVIFLSTPNLKSDEIDFENVNYIPPWRFEESPELKLQPDDVLLAKDGNTLGITNVVRTLPGPATVNGSIAVIRPRAIDSRFLRYVLASSATQDQIEAVKAGMGVPHLFQWDINRLPVPIPPAAKQRAIADFLDAETARIDALITKKRRMIELLDEADRSLVDESFRREPPSKGVRLGRLAVLQTGLTLDAARDPGSDAITLPYLRVANVQAGHLDLNEVKTVTVSGTIARRCTLRPGDVLMTEGGDLDKLGRGTVWQGEIETCLHQNHVFAVRPDPSRLLPTYLAALTRTSKARRYFESTGTRSTNLASTNSAKVMDFKIPLTSIQEQRSILDRYKERSSTLISCRTLLTRQLDLLKEHRQALITAAVTGELEIQGVAA